MLQHAHHLAGVAELGVVPDVEHDVVALDDGRLSLLTDSPVWASRLRFAAPDLLAALAARGIEASFADGATVTRIIAADSARWEPVIRKANIHVE